MRKTRRLAALLWVLPLWSLGWLRADTIETKQDERLKGRVVREDPKQVVLRTAYGELTVPRSAVKKHTRSTYVVELVDGSKVEGEIVGETAEALALKVGGKPRQVPRADVKAVAEKRPAKRPKPPSPRRLVALHRRVLERFGKKDYAGALATCKEILKAKPDDPTALYNSACACARLADKPKALDFLRRAVEAGFVNFAHVEQDPDLESLRGEAAFRELLARREHYVAQASKRTVERLTEALAKKGIDAKRYKSVFDAERNFVYLHAKSDAEIAELRRSLEAYADCQWRDLFQNKPKQPLYIVVLTAADSPKVFRRGVGGMYNPGSRTLFCSDMPMHKLLRLDVVIHEFTHALHFADMGARHQQHPIWLVEGLATLFETSDRNGTVVPRHSHRLVVAQAAARARQLVPWPTFMKLNHMQFMMRARATYAQARYMLFYMHQKGLLKRFYDEYTAKENYARDRSAVDSFQVVFGKPIEAVERDWRAWLLKQKVPPIPFLGVQTRDDKGRTVVVRVTGGSPAAKAGIKAGDAITALAGHPVGSPGSLIAAVARCKVGQEVEVELSRGKKPLTVKAKLAKRRGLVRPTRRPAPYLGLTVEQKDGAVVIKEVAAGSPAAKAGLKPGAVLLAFAGKPQKTVRGFLAALRARKAGQKVPIKVKDGDKTRTVTAQLAPQPGAK